MAHMIVQPDGHVNVQVGTKSQGQGHSTVFAQVAADALTIPINHIDVRDGDTETLPYGLGTWGSRSAVMGGAAVAIAAGTIRDKMIKIAAAMLGAKPDAVALVDGAFLAGEARIAFGDVANTAYMHPFLLPADVDMGLATIAAYDPRNTDPFPNPENGQFDVAATYSTGVGVAQVEVDINTGETTIDQFLLIHDCGTVINPMILDGQIQGAFAQAVGATFFEEFLYNEDGQPLCSTLLDYNIPAFGNVPRVTVVHRETPSSLPGGFRGAGEGAIIVAPSALANAVHDALRPLGVPIRQTNLGANHLRELLRGAEVKVNVLAGVGDPQRKPG